VSQFRETAEQEAFPRIAAQELLSKDCYAGTTAFVAGRGGGASSRLPRNGYLTPRGVGIFSQRDCQPRQGRSDTEGYSACPHEH
jgi:hypothetical protein